MTKPTGFALALCQGVPLKGEPLPRQYQGASIDPGVTAGAGNAIYPHVWNRYRGLSRCFISRLRSALLWCGPKSRWVCIVPGSTRGSAPRARNAPRDCLHPTIYGLEPQGCGLGLRPSKPQINSEFPVLGIIADIFPQEKKKRVFIPYILRVDWRVDWRVDCCVDCSQVARENE